MEEITITQALSRVKVLEKRHEKLLRELRLVAVRHGSKLRSPNSSYKEEDFVDAAKSMMQSISDIYNNILFIKNAIAVSNANTKVRIAGEEMTVQEAILRKQYLNLRKDQIRKFKELLTRARQEFDEALEENSDKIENLLKGDTSDPKSKDQVARRKETEDYINSTRQVVLIDPCDLQGTLPALEKDFEDFESNVDYALSESNSITKIQLP
jgi:DNA repair exonuclease SbcCD nuclease subunit